MHSWPSTVLAPMRTSPSWARILRAVADPRPAPEVDHGVLADLERHARADEGEAVGLQAPAEAQLQPSQAQRAAARSSDVEHPVRAHPAQQHQRPAVARRGLAARTCGGSPVTRGGVRTDVHGRKGSLRGSMAEDSLAQRLLAGDKRALARAITLVESDDPAGWELVREVYPQTGQGGGHRPHRCARRRQVDAHRRADQAAPRGRPPGRGALDRPVVAVHPRARCSATASASPSTSSTPASSSARWPTAARSAA